MEEYMDLDMRNFGNHVRNILLRRRAGEESEGPGFDSCEKACEHNLGANRRSVLRMHDFCSVGLREP